MTLWLEAVLGPAPTQHENSRLSIVQLATPILESVYRIPGGVVSNTNHLLSDYCTNPSKKKSNKRKQDEMRSELLMSKTLQCEPKRSFAEYLEAISKLQC